MVDLQQLAMMTNTQKLDMDAVFYSLLSANLSPEKLLRVPAFLPMLSQFLTGNWDLKQFIENCRKLNVINKGSLEEG